jgi:DNA polymerase-1
MVNLQKRLRHGFRSVLILQVHDELILDVYHAELESIKELVRNEMQNVLKLKVPLLVDIGVGSNWLEAH